MHSKAHRMALVAPLVAALLAAGHPAWGGEAGASPASGSGQAATQVSRFGEYEGYSEARFDTWVRQSQYVTMDDGVRLAVDIVRPAVDGQAVDEALPVLLTFTRYQRNPTGLYRYLAEQEGKPFGDEVISMVDDMPMLQHLVRHGYVVASVAVRGNATSFGRDVGIFSSRETEDSYQVIDWLAKQPWSDGNVGMFGGSYLGITQYMAASTRHPALKAIVPDVALYDLYDIFYNGGIYKNDYVKQWGEAVAALDTVIKSVPVDEDPDGTLMEEAMASHVDNWEPITRLAGAPFRDDVLADWNWSDFGVISVLDELNASGVAIYHYTGWYDAFIYQAPLMYLNYPGEDRLTIGPWGHDRWNEVIDAERVRVSTAEHHRWFDYWLKDIDNGVLDDPKVNYAITDVPGQAWSWSSSPDWPPAGTVETTLYLGGERSGSVASLNDGALGFSPVADEAADSFRVDVTTTTGTNSRWDNCTGPILDYPDMTPNDEKSLTYTTAPLAGDLTVVGYPMVKLRARTDSPDGDFYVLLEEVDRDGVSHLVTEGQLRLSMRMTDPAQKATWHDHFWRRQKREDVLPVEPGTWYEVDIDLLPTAHLFNAGHRIRVTVMGADKDNTVLPEHQDAELGVALGGAHGSRLVLPVVVE